jgi:hypothetical protein
MLALQAHSTVFCGFLVLFLNPQTLASSFLDLIPSIIIGSNLLLSDIAPT